MNEWDSKVTRRALPTFDEEGAEFDRWYAEEYLPQLEREMVEATKDDRG